MTRCSHVLHWVRDIHRAVSDFRRLGFDVQYATKPEKAQHAHIWFSTGPLIELLTTPRSAKLFKWPIEWIAGRGSGRRMLGWAQGGERLCDVAVLVDTADLASALEPVRRAGVPVGRAIRWRRTTPGGDEISFRFAYPRHACLPFFVTPYSPPLRPDVSHANGAERLSRVVMGVAPADATALTAIIGDDPTFELVSAERTGVLAIELAGLRAELDARWLHGAVVRRAAGVGEASRREPLRSPP